MRTPTARSSSRATGTFLLHRDPTSHLPRLTLPGTAARPGVCRVCCGPALAGRAMCFACAGSAAASAAPWLPSFRCDCARCPDPLYTVLLGYKEAPVSETRAALRADGAAGRGFVGGHAACLASAVGGAFDLVSPCRRRPAIGRDPRGRWTDWARGGVPTDAAGARTSCDGPAPVGHMRTAPRRLRDAVCRHRCCAGRGWCCSTTPTSAVPGRRAGPPRCVRRRGGGADRGARPRPAS